MFAAFALAALAAPCPLEADLEAPFSVDIDPAHLRSSLLIEVYANGASAEWLTAVREVLDTHAIDAVVIFPVTSPPADIALWLAAGHVPAVDLDAPGEVADPILAAKSIKRRIAALNKVIGVKPQVALVPLTRRTDEAIIGYGGISAILEEDGPGGGNPRRAAAYPAQIAKSVIIPAGPYRGACGGSPVYPFSPAAADRAATALIAADGGVVRLGLVGGSGTLEDAAILGRWLDTHHVVTALPAQIRAQALGTPLPVGIEGPVVTVSDVRAAAEALRDASVVPRVLPGGLSATEAWLAFAQLLAGRETGDVVPLLSLAGPSDNAKSVLTGPVGVSTDDLKHTVAAVLAVLPKQVPSQLPIGGETFTAAETLLLFASAIRGEEPTTHPVTVSEPNAVGLGWGTSGP